MAARWLDEHARGVPCGLCKGDGQIETGVLAGGDYERLPPHEREPVPIVRCPACSGTGSVPDAAAARAEFIRVQCRPCSCLRPGYLPMCDRCQREHDLWHSRRGADWLLDFPGVPFTDRHLCLEREAMATAERPHYPVYVVRRGFVDELRCRLADFTEATARAIFSAHPVTKVVILDAEPQDYHNNGDKRVYGWWRVHDTVVAHEPRPCDLPAELWEWVARYPGRIDRGSWADFRSHAAAASALEWGAVQWARTLAGLPPGPGGEGLRAGRENPRSGAVSGRKD